MRVSVTLLICLVSTSTAVARSLVFYSNGRAWPLLKSDTEILIRPAPGANAGRVQLELADRTTNLHAVSCHTGLLLATVDRADEAAVSDWARAPGIDLVIHVYRLSANGPPVFMTDEVVVGFVNQLDQAQILAFCDEYGAEMIRSIEGLESTYVLRVLDGYGDAAVRTAATMYEDPRTRFSHSMPSWPRSPP